jgi:CDP-diacylglycerol--serine O-phosphatidyltransferase
MALLMQFRALLPCATTGLTLLLGLAGIEAARVGNADAALACVLLAVIPDGLDGVLARRWGVASAFGRHLDALADVVAFGVAPGMAFAVRHPEVSEAVRLWVLAAVALAGAWRLARFQAETSRTEFSGLPITTAGPLFAATMAAPHSVVEPSQATLGALLWSAALAGLMVSRVPHPRVTRGTLGKLLPLIALLFVVLLVVNRPAAFVGAQLALTVYAGWGLLRAAGAALRPPPGPPHPRPATRGA